ncbi:MAG: hypothetical protein WBK28_01005 [Minisyncoccia bacterium]
MQTILSNKVVLGALGVVVVGAGLLAAFGGGTRDAGIDVRNTACQDLAAARLAVATELGERTQAAADALAKNKNDISNAYWEKNQALEKEYYACSSRALTSDPCKEASDRITALYHEIMADFEADKGFNEAKFNEREEAKKEYTKCVEETHKPEFYAEKEAACVAALAAGREANLAERAAADAAAKQQHDEDVASAQAAHDAKQATLNEIEKKCTEPGGTSAVRIGPLTTEGSGAAVSPGSSACTGTFVGNDAELERQLGRLEAQLAQAKAGGKTDGLSGSDHLQEAVDRIREELKNKPRSCKVDADCGDAVPVCCSASEVGQAYCNAGTCASKKTTCESPEICAGKPAMCVAPTTGGKQQDGVYLSRTIPEIGSCSQNLQVLTLEQATSESVRYSINGSIPSWLKIDKPGGALPGSVNVTYTCNAVQAFGPGTYTANGAITVYNTANELINTIPFNVSITVTPSEKTVDVIEYNGKLLPVADLIVEDEIGCGAEHWHAAQGVVTALDGSQVSDPGPQCGYGKVKDKPIRTVPDTRKGGTIEVRGLEGLKQY